MVRKFAAAFLVAAVVAVASHAANQERIWPGNTMSRGPLVVHYHPEAGEEAAEVLDVLATAAARYADRLPIGEEPVHVVVAQSLAEFNQYAPSYGHLEIEGVAHSEAGWIVVKSRALHRPDSSFPATLRHELVHVLLGRSTDPINLPRWLNEGVAMMLSGELRWSAPLRLTRMQAAGDVIPYAHLDFAFTTGDGRRVANAYAQAFGMTRYLRDEIGETAFWDMILSLEDQSFPDALQEYAGLTPRALWKQWRDSLWTVALVVSLMSGFTAFQVMAFLAFFAYLRKRRQGRRILEQWEEEEEDDDEVFTVWDLEDQDPPYPWENDDDDRY